MRRPARPISLPGMPLEMNDTVRGLLDSPNMAVLATLNPDGGPQSSVVWVSRDGGDLLISTTRGRRKALNMLRDPRVGLTVFDPADRTLRLGILGPPPNVPYRGDPGIFGPRPGTRDDGDRELFHAPPPRASSASEMTDEGVATAAIGQAGSGTEFRGSKASVKGAPAGEPIDSQR